MREPFAAEGDEGRLVERGAVPNDDEGLRRLAPPRMRHADDRGVGHVGVLVQARFDLQRGHVLSPTDDDVLLAIGDPQDAVLELAAVAGREPFAVERRLRNLGLAPVADHALRGAGEHLAGTVHAKPHADERRSGGGKPTGALRRCRLLGGQHSVDGQHRARLGQTVGVDHLPARRALELLDHRGGSRRAAGDHARHALAGNDLAGGAPSLGGLHDRGSHGRGTTEQGDVLPLDAPQDLGAADLALNDVGDSHRSRSERQPPTVDVKQRQRVEVAVALAEPEAPAHGHRVEPVAAVREDDTLGSRRRP